MDVLWVVALLFWLSGLAFAAWMTARLTPPRRYGPAEETLRHRLARGDISAAEYERDRDILLREPARTGWREWLWGDPGTAARPGRPAPVVFADGSLVTLLTAAEIADKLGERNREATAQIRRTVRVLGPERALGLLSRALDMDRHVSGSAAAGIRATPRETYFRLVREAATPEQSERIFAQWREIRPSR